MDYKGIYYGDNKVHKFYEYGAHFRYLDSYRQLELIKVKEFEEIYSSTRNKSNENIHQTIYITDKSKNPVISRNKNNNIYYNNPNSQNLNFNMTSANMMRIRKKSANLHSNLINNKVVYFYLRNRNNNIINNHLINDKVKNNKIMINNSSRNKVIYQQNSDNIAYYNKLNQKNLNSNKMNNANHHFKYSSFDNYDREKNLKYFLHLKSRNKNSINGLNSIKSVENRINNILVNSKEKNCGGENLFFNKTIHPKNKSLIFVSPNIYKKKINNINIPSKYINKNIISYKFNQEKFNSGEDIITNYELRNYNYK